MVNATGKIELTGVQIEYDKLNQLFPKNDTITDEEMKQALQILKDGCEERRCRYCPVMCTCGAYFDEASPAMWDLEKDKLSDE